MTPDEAHELLRKFRLGLCTDREIDLINKWYDSIEDKNTTTLEYEVNFEALKNEMHDNINSAIDNQEGKERPFYMSYFWKIAAVLIVAVGTIFAFYKKDSTQNEISQEVASVKEEGLSGASDGRITLADGTVVWVKKGSKLAYPKQFFGNTREVTLIGEAFFEVHKDPSKPFIIHSGNLITKVLGTSFNVKAYENDRAAEVTVVTGKVSVSLKEVTRGKLSNVILTPNQKVTYLRELNQLVRYEERNAQKYKLIAENALNFNEASMEEILAKVSIAYSVKVRFENEDIKRCVITADLSDQSLESSLKILTRSIGAKFTILQNEVLISGKGCL